MRGLITIIKHKTKKVNLAKEIFFKNFSREVRKIILNFIFSERTRAAAAAAAILPTVLAAASSARVGAKVQSNAEAEQFKVQFSSSFSASLNIGRFSFSF